MQQREADKAAGRHAQRRTDAGAMEVFAGTDVEGTDVEEAATTTAIVSEEAASATATDVADMIAEAVSGRAGSSSAVADAASSSAVADAAKPSPSDRMLRAATADLEAQRPADASGHAWANDSQLHADT